MLIYKITIKKRLLLSACLLVCVLAGSAQTYLPSPAVLTGTLAPGEYINNTSITLSSTSPGFSFTASGSSMLYLHILPDCQQINTIPSANQNYIITSVPRTAMGTFSIAGRTTCDIMQTVQYLDGLGRPIQTVQVKGSPLGMDVVQPITYDQFGREAVKYLPYALTGGTSDGSYKTNAIAAQAQFYNPGNTAATQQSTGVVNTSFPSATTVFEPSPLNRTVEQGAPGASWQTGGGHTVTTHYGTNAASDVILWQVNSTNNGLSGGNTYYTAGTLYATTATDENGNNTIEYKDMKGHVVCKKVPDPANAGSYIATYYVYNDLDNLSYVMPPKPDGTAYPAAISETDALFMGYMYGYHYDGRSRLIEKKVPGKGWEYMVYNRIDQVIFTQDAVQRGKPTQEWTYIKYDAQGRVAITGIWSAGTVTGYQGETNLASPNHILEQWLTTWAVNNLPVLWVTRDNTQASGYSYIDPAGPVLTTNYYDDYNGLTNVPADFPTSGYSTMTRGLPTVTKTAVLNTIYNATPDMLFTANYYDDLGRVKKTYQQHYLGGTTKLSPYNYDVVTNSYNFNNQITGVIRQHYKNVSNVASLMVTTNASISYDHMGRKIQTFEKIDSGPNILLAQSDYNEIGQVKAKHLHGATGAAPYLQDIYYKYNERGWLKRINDPVNTPTTTRMFAEQLNYDSVKYAATPNYNGNISEQDYFSKDGARQHVVYAYDRLNRLTGGTSSAGYSETGIQYDNLGNLKQLIRGGNTGVYAYISGTSQLQSVSGITNSNYTYDFNGNAKHDGKNNATLTYNMLNLPQTATASTPTAISLTYYYDAAGNKLRKVSAGNATDYINGIQYKPDGTIDFIQTEEGRAVPVTGGYEYQYTLTDHLGNNRFTFGTKTGVAAKLQVDDYYPFGLDVNTVVSSPKNEYLYNKKELQEELGEYDYGARFYDPVIGRWTSVDPLVELGQESMTPYAYVLNNPIRLTDPDGRAPEDGPTPKWWRTTVFTLSHPIAAAAIGSVSPGATNISTNAARFSTRGSSASAKESVLDEPSDMGNEGTQVNAFRHTLWQATITSEFGGDIAKEVGFAHEDNPNSNWSVNYNEKSFKTLAAADERIDLTNNVTGRDIGAANKGMGMRDLALKVLDVFKKDGLMTATRQADGTFKMTKTKITDAQYKALQNVFKNLDNSGYTAAEQEQRRKKEREETGSHIK